MKRHYSNALMALVAAVALVLSALSPALAINVTVTYDSNLNQFQIGATSGTLPVSASVTPGSTYTASSNTGNLARAGFSFAGWNTLANGTGTQVAAGTGTLVVNANTTLYAQWSIPQSARLIGQTGSMYTITNSPPVTNGSKCTSGGVRGMTSDGSFIYVRMSGDATYICKLSLTGTVQAALPIGTGIASIPTDSMALAYSNGCIFVRSSGGAISSVYCIDLTDNSINEIQLPAGKTIMAGQGWGSGNLISFPDGRIGAVSQPNQTLTVGTGANQCPATLFCKILRLYNLAKTGKNVVLTFSEDIILADNSSNWPDDDHGIATDGTYLYQINFNSGYKVYALASGSPSYLVFNGVDGTGCNATSPSYCAINTPNTGLSFSNATYIGRSHGTNQYFIGDYSANKFWISTSSAPPAGPGSLTPAALSIPTISGNIYKGISIAINVSSNVAGKVSFFADGKRIPNCQRISTSGTAPTFISTCNWKPAVTALHSIYTEITPTNQLLSGARSGLAKFWVLKRQTLR